MNRLLRGRRRVAERAIAFVSERFLKDKNQSRGAIFVGGPSAEFCRGTSVVETYLAGTTASVSISPPFGPLKEDC
jgi:hypothetical protein